MAFKTSADYWRGYRAAKIFAFLNAIDHYKAENEAGIDSRESEAYLTGFHAGIAAMEKELKKMIAHEKALKKKGMQNDVPSRKR